jgi:hypothetical protein
MRYPQRPRMGMGAFAPEKKAAAGLRTTAAFQTACTTHYSDSYRIAASLLDRLAAVRETGRHRALGHLSRELLAARPRPLRGSR